MTIDQELRLSCYRQVADIDAEHAVSLVQHVHSGKFFVKKLLTVYNADIYRFLQSHPIANTPKIILAEEDAHVLTVIEEYIPGDTLEEILDEKGPLSEDQVIGITLRLCTILEEFHHCTPAIVNRDIKPSNIKITPDGFVKLLDMNAAKWSSQDASRDTVLLGTQGYAAPEQYGFGASGTQTDIYAVGVLMNVMLTGHLPNELPVSGPIGSLIHNCTELSPSTRIQSISELQAALNALSGHQPAKPPDWMKFMPPGFRSNNIILWLFSAIGYAFLLYVGCGLIVENVSSTELLLNKITFIAAALCMVFFNGNYLNIHQKFVMTRSRKLWIRWPGILLVDTAILVIWVIVLDLLVSVFVH